MEGPLGRPDGSNYQSGGGHDGDGGDDGQGQTNPEIPVEVQPLVKEWLEANPEALRNVLKKIEHDPVLNRLPRDSHAYKGIFLMEVGHQISGSRKGVRSQIGILDKLAWASATPLG